jgi:hypothetical protein
MPAGRMDFCVLVKKKKEGIRQKEKAKENAGQ